MAEKPKQHKTKELDLSDELDQDDRSDEAAERSYYYDDAHGYEEFDPEADDDGDDDAEETD